MSGQKVIRRGAALRARLHDDEASVLPLIIFYAALAMALIIIVMAATSLYLERKRLYTLADGAALVGAESFELDQVSLTDGALRPTLDSTQVSSAVRDYVSDTASGFDALSVDRADAADGRSATVTISAYWRPPILTVLLPEGLRVEVTSVARSVFR